MQRPFSPYARPAESGLKKSIRFGDQGDAAARSSMSRLVNLSVSHRGSTRFLETSAGLEFSKTSVYGPNTLPEVGRQSHNRQSEHAHFDSRRSRIAHLHEASEDIMFVDKGKLTALLNSGLDEGGQDSDADNSAPPVVERVSLEIQIL
jgi:hypothetical protein